MNYAENGRNGAGTDAHRRCRWLIDWLPKAKQVELEAKGDLPWVDWNAVVGEVRGKFETKISPE